MNETIRKLATETFVIATDGDIGFANANMVEEFAKLIINECLSICDAKAEELVFSENEWTPLGAVEDVYETIAERFGIE